MFIYSWIPVISTCKCKPALSHSKHLSKLSVSQESNTYATVYCEKMIIIEETWVSFYFLSPPPPLFTFNKESYGKAILEYQLERKKKKSNIAELTFGFYAAGERKTFTCAHSKNQEHMCFSIFMFRRGVQGEVGLERDYV